MSQVHEKLSELPHPGGDHLPPDLHIVRASTAPARAHFAQSKIVRSVAFALTLIAAFVIWRHWHHHVLAPVALKSVPSAAEIKAAIAHGQSASIIASLEAAAQAANQAADHSADNLQPQNAATFINLAYAYKANGQLAQAEMALQKSLSLDPTGAVAYNNMGRVRASKREWPAAISFYQKAIELRHDYADAQMNLAAAFESINAWDRSIFAYQNFLRIDQAHPDLRVAIEKRIRLLRALKTYMETYTEKASAKSPAKTKDES